MKSKIGGWIVPLLFAIVISLSLLSIYFLNSFSGRERNNTALGFQVFILIGVVLLLILNYRSKKKYQIKFKQINSNLNTNNQTYLFDSGEDLSNKNFEEMSSIFFDNLHKLTQFVQKISSGDFDIKWEGLNESNHKLNDHNMVGELTRLQQWMKTKKVEDDRRFWLNEGLAQFSMLVRNNQENSKQMYEQAVCFLVKYLEVQQGSVFVLNEEQNAALELMACYALGRKKFVNKKIELGEGLIGQTFLEGEPTLLFEVPQGYTQITSGLGDSTPSCVAIVPMKYNGVNEGILEFAGFKKLVPHEIEFIEKAGSFFASAILNSRSSGKMTGLLEAAQKQAVELQAQEEEARQNMEELESIQEDISRRNKEMEAVQQDLYRTSSLLESLLESADDTIYFKDEKSRFIKVSKSFLKIANIINVNELIGKNDFDFVSEEDARPKFEAEMDIIRTGVPLRIEEKDMLNDGSISYISTKKFALKDRSGKVVGTFGISHDITPYKKAVLEVEQLKSEWQKEKERLERELEIYKMKSLISS